MAGALWENGWQRPTCKYGMQTCGGNFTWLTLRRMLISDTARKMLFFHFSFLALEVDCKDVIFFLLSAYRILLYFVSVRFGWTCSIYDNITSLANIDSLYRVFAGTYFSWGISKAKNTLKMRYCDSIYFTFFCFWGSVSQCRTGLTWTPGNPVASIYPNAGNVCGSHHAWVV